MNKEPGRLGGEGTRAPPSFERNLGKFGAHALLNYFGFPLAKPHLVCTCLDMLIDAMIFEWKFSCVRIPLVGVFVYRSIGGYLLMSLSYGSKNM